MGVGTPDAVRGSGVKVRVVRVATVSPGGAADAVFSGSTGTREAGQLWGLRVHAQVSGGRHGRGGQAPTKVGSRARVVDTSGQERSPQP